MAKKPTIKPSTLAWLMAAYHIAALIKDAEAVKTNWDRYQQDPTSGNLARLLVAEGVFFSDAASV